MLFVEIPPYRDPTIHHAVKVNFYVINGRRKRSQAQHFTYTPLTGESILALPLHLLVIIRTEYGHTLH
jgi:hypothetical protein